MGIKELCTSMAQTLAVGQDLRGFTTRNIGDWTRERVNQLELWRVGWVFLPLGRAVLMVLLRLEKQRVFEYTLLLKAQECLYPIAPHLPMVVKEIR